MTRTGSSGARVTHLLALQEELLARAPPPSTGLEEDLHSHHARLEEQGELFSPSDGDDLARLIITHISSAADEPS